MRPCACLVTAVILLFIYVGMPWLPLPFSFPDPTWITSHTAEARHVYGTGTFIEILRFRIAEIPQIAKLHVYIFPRTLALILFGAWLYRSGALRRLGEHAAALLIAGLLLVGLGMLLTAQDVGYVSLIDAGPIGGSAMGVLAPLLVALGYAALVFAASGNGRARAALRWAVPVGRTAFSNYILQSIVLGLLFYGYGFGLMGHVGATVGLGIAIAVYSFQAWVSGRWLRTHRFGPLEWLWRSLMYGKRQPWRRRPVGINPAKIDGYSRG